MEWRLPKGYHQRHGGPHAEREAITAASPDVELTGATWYVTLEPCCHHGKTPPCTEAVIAAKPARVVVATKDPFPEVAGRGIALLEQAGIEVEVGVCEEEANRLNAPYRKRITSRRPWVVAKWAMTLDGRIASRTGDSRWISSDASRERVHALRGRVDAIVTGMGTVRSDDPLLTARPSGPRTASRIVLDQRAELSPDSNLVKSIDTAPVVIVCGENADQANVEQLQRAGCTVLPISTTDRVSTVNALLDWCDNEGMTNLMLEAGGAVIGSFFAARAIDEYQVYVAGKVIGGRDATGPIEGLGLEMISDSPVLEPLRVEAIDGDLLITTRRKC